MPATVDHDEAPEQDQHCADLLDCCGSDRIEGRKVRLWRATGSDGQVAQVWAQNEEEGAEYTRHRHYWDDEEVKPVFEPVELVPVGIPEGYVPPNT